MTTHTLTATAPRSTSVRDASTLLRRTLQVDAASSALSAIAFLLGGTALAERLGSPLPLAWTAVFLLAFAGFVAWVGSRETIPLRAAWTVVALNLLWVAASVVEIALGMYSTLGSWVFGAMALFVAVLADVQIVGILRIGRIQGIRRAAK
jgi:hypothetical protein